MKCENCGHEMGDGESVPKNLIRKALNDIIDSTDDGELKLKALSELSRLEQYTGANMKRDQKKIGVFIVQESTLRKGPGKNVEGGS